LTAYKKALDTYKDRAARYLTPEEQVAIENGEETIGEIKDDEVIEQINPDPYSPVARVFDETCIGWCSDRIQTLWFLETRRKEAQALFDQNGYLFLNDVYKMLGYPLTQAGQLLGWLKNSENGDNYISFGIENIEDENVRMFRNGRIKYVVLDFNVDGPIIDGLQLNPKTCNWMPKV